MKEVLVEKDVIAEFLPAVKTYRDMEMHAEKKTRLAEMGLTLTKHRANIFDEAMVSVNP